MEIIGNKETIRVARKFGKESNRQQHSCNVCDSSFPYPERRRIERPQILSRTNFIRHYLRARYKILLFNTTPVHVCSVEDVLCVSDVLSKSRVWLDAVTTMHETHHSREFYSVARQPSGGYRTRKNPNSTHSVYEPCPTYGIRRQATIFARSSCRNSLDFPVKPSVRECIDDG